MNPSTSRNGVQAPNAWKVLVLLLLANLLNVYDRVLPAVLAEPLRLQYNLTDVHIGIVGTVFTLVYAIAGIPLGMLADQWSRARLLGVALTLWSGFTALSGVAQGYASFLLARIGVGVGEAALAPAATSLIGDMFPPNKRSRAIGIYMIGLPLGTVIGFVSVGAIASAFQSWRVPFFVAAVPGLMLAAAVWFIREPQRGASDSAEPLGAGVSTGLRELMRLRAFWWLVLSGIGYNFAAYGVATFLVPLLQRYYGMSLINAANSAGLVIGATGLVALGLGSFLGDWVQRRHPQGRLLLAAVALAAGAVFAWFGLRSSSPLWFVALFSVGWFSSYLYSPCIYPALQDLVAPRMRATAMGAYFAAMYVLGAAFGSVAVGALSDQFAENARQAEGVAALLSDAHRAVGLHGAMVIVPVALLVASAACLLAALSRRQVDRLRPLGVTPAA